MKLPDPAVLEKSSSGWRWGSVKLLTPTSGGMRVRAVESSSLKTRTSFLAERRRRFFEN
jgi:hypothetical protein